MRQSVCVLMEGTPEGINPVEVEKTLKKLTYVVAVHDLHIWSLSVGKPSLSVHILVDSDKNRGAVLESSVEILASVYGIEHATIQVEEAVDDIYCNPFSAVFARRSPHLVSVRHSSSSSFLDKSITNRLLPSSPCSYGTLY